MKQTSKIDFLAAACGVASAVAAYAAVKAGFDYVSPHSFKTLATALSVTGGALASFYAYDFVSRGQLSRWASTPANKPKP